MEIVIVGGGKLGASLCRDLANEGHEIVLIDKDQAIIDAFTDDIDIRGIIGNGSSREAQIEADVPACDVFISVTPTDETNLIASIIANRLGAKFSIARVRSPEFADDLAFFKKEVGVNMLINPDALSAAEMVRAFDYPSANMIESFADGRVTLVKIRVNKGASIIGRTLASIRASIPNLLLCVIERNFSAFIPAGDTIIQEDDQIQLTGEPAAIDAFSHICGHANKRWHSTLIVGGSRISYYLIPALLERGIRIKVIERDSDTANRLAIAFPQIEVIIGDGTNQKFLREMHLANFDVAIALTHIDEENLMLSLYSHQQGVRKTITKVNRSELTKLIDPENLDTVIVPHISAGDVIIRYVRSREKSSDSALESYARLSTDGVEASEFIVSEGNRATENPIQHLHLHKGLIIANIMRAQERIIPTGADQLRPGDHVLIVSTGRRLLQLDDILAEKSG